MYPGRLGARYTGLGAQTLALKKGFLTSFFSVAIQQSRNGLEDKKQTEDVELKEGTVYKSVFIHLNNM